MAVLIKPKSKRKGKPTQVSSVWHICFWDRSKKRTRVFSTLCRQKKNAERKLRQFIDLLESGEYYDKYAPNNPFLCQIESKAKEQQELAMETLLVAYEQALAAGQVRKRGKGKPPQAKHVALVMSHIRKITEGLRTATDLSPEKVAAAVAKHTTTQQTAKHYGRAIKAFATWLCSSGRLPHDPLAAYQVAEVTAEDVAYPRGAFSHEQVQALVRAAMTGPVCRKLSGEQRALLYILAANSGLRASECAALRKRDFCQENNTVSIAGNKTKNGKAATIPLPGFVWEAFAPHLAELADEALLWPGRWAEGKKGAELLRADAARTDPPMIIGKPGIAKYGFALDFHSFRHYYISQVDRAGVSERLARKLARASSGALLDRYTHREQTELAAAVAGFPRLRLGAE